MRAEARRMNERVYSCELDLSRQLSTQYDSTTVAPVEDDARAASAFRERATDGTSRCAVNGVNNYKCRP